MGVNGVPQDRKHSQLGGKKLNKPVAAGSGGAATGGGCGSHAIVADPAAWSAADVMVTSLIFAAVLAVAAWTVVALVAWSQRSERP